MNFLFRLLPFLFVCSLALSCKKNSLYPGNQQTVTSFRATLTGANAGTSSAATGSFAGSYNSSTKTLNFTLSYTGLTPTAWHIHNVDNSNVEFLLGVIVALPLQSSLSGFTAAEENDLLENKYYVNIHSAAYSGGEISGIIIKQ
jgi:hypothetical protein